MKCLVLGQTWPVVACRWDRGCSMAWLRPIVENADPCWVECGLAVKLGCEWMLDVELSCAVRFAMAAACGATWRRLRELWFSCRLGTCWLCGAATVVRCIAIAADGSRSRAFGDPG